MIAVLSIEPDTINLSLWLNDIDLTHCLCLLCLYSILPLLVSYTITEPSLYPTTIILSSLLNDIDYILDLCSSITYSTLIINILMKFIYFIIIIFLLYTFYIFRVVTNALND